MQTNIYNSYNKCDIYNNYVIQSIFSVCLRQKSFIMLLNIYIYVIPHLQAIITLRVRCLGNKIKIVYTYILYYMYHVYNNLNMSRELDWPCLK